MSTVLHGEFGKAAPSSKSREATWGRAGVMRAESEASQRRAVIADRRRRMRESDARAYEAWRYGFMVPWRITYALDSGGHEGPEVDVACGAQEPAVDEWEAGTRYPSFEQVTLLATLTGMAAEFFFIQSEPLEMQSTTMWGHMTQREREQWRPPITEFAEDAAERCPGTKDYQEIHLF